jgi:hypothetical protein
MARYLLFMAWHIEVRNLTETNSNRIFDFRIIVFADGSSGILTSETSICCDILCTDINDGVVQICPRAENFSAYFWRRFQE